MAFKFAFVSNCSAVCLCFISKSAEIFSSLDERAEELTVKRGEILLCSFFFFLYFCAAPADLEESLVPRTQRSGVARCRDLRRPEFPSSAELLMQGNWPIYQNHEETELRSHRCIKNKIRWTRERRRARGRRRTGRRWWRRISGRRTSTDHRHRPPVCTADVARSELP